MGTATSNSIFAKESFVSSFRDEDPAVMRVSEGEPATLKCQPPDGYPRPDLYWMIQVGMPCVDICSDSLYFFLLVMYVFIRMHRYAYMHACVYM